VAILSWYKEVGGLRVAKLAVVLVAAGQGGSKRPVLQRRVLLVPPMFPLMFLKLYERKEAITVAVFLSDLRLMMKHSGDSVTP
jgi:hypothetical protein